jgi:hypothetical protein
LINPIDGQWDVQLINDIFWPIDAHRILQIPIANGREDLVAWHHEPEWYIFSEISLPLSMETQIWIKYSITTGRKHGRN